MFTHLNFNNYYDRSMNLRINTEINYDKNTIINLLEYFLNIITVTRIEKDNIARFDKDDIQIITASYNIV